MISEPRPSEFIHTVHVIHFVEPIWISVSVQIGVSVCARVCVKAVRACCIKCVKADSVEALQADYSGPRLAAQLGLLPLYLPLFVPLVETVVLR